MGYAAAPVATYAAPVSTMAYGAPVVEQPVYTVSPERFQRIMAGEPLTNEEIAELTGAGPAVVTEYGASAVTETVVTETAAVDAPVAAKTSKKSSKKKLSSKKKAKGCC